MDEAIKAKEVAEKKLVDEDFVGAKEYILKAQTLYPGLDGVSQLLIILDVYISLKNKVNGEADWYGVLDVQPFDDHETIRKQYRKLVLMIHPDKNRSVGADGAFKIISEAWSLLSDKAKRDAYNQRRNSKGSQQKDSAESVHSANSATSKRKSCSSTSTNQTGPPPFPHSVPAEAQVPPPAPVQVVHTFWTICYKCKRPYEYLKVYINHTLLCPNCRIPFLATVMLLPVNSAQPAEAPGWAPSPSGPCSYAQTSVPLNFTQPAAQATRCAPLPPGPYSYAQWSGLFNFTQPAAQATGWTPSPSGPSSYSQIPVQMNVTQPSAQVMGCASCGPGSYPHIDISTRQLFIELIRVCEDFLAQLDSKRRKM